MIEATAIQRTAPSTLAGPQVPREKIDLLKRTIAKGATDDELELFVAVCNRLRLDPFARQIHAVKRFDSKAGRDVMTVLVGIDGFRLTASRTGEYLGQTEISWCGKDGAWRPVWLEDQPPAAARVGVYRAGFKEPLVRTARWASYAQVTKEGKPSQTWARMPDLMLGKCAEALALRAAFPAELSGVYAPEELDASVAPQPAMPPPPSPAPGRRRETTKAAAVVDVLPDGPDPREAVRVLTYEETEGSTGGKDWTRCRAELSDGRSVTTFDLGLAAAVISAQATGALVLVDVERTPRGLKLLAITAAGEAGPDA